MPLTSWTEREELPSVLQSIVVGSDIRHSRGKIFYERRHVEGVAVDDDDSTGERTGRVGSLGESGTPTRMTGSGKERPGTLARERLIATWMRYDSAVRSSG